MFFSSAAIFISSVDAKSDICPSNSSLLCLPRVPLSVSSLCDTTTSISLERPVISSSDKKPAISLALDVTTAGTPASSATSIP